MRAYCATARSTPPISRNVISIALGFDLRRHASPPAPDRARIPRAVRWRARPAPEPSAGRRVRASRDPARRRVTLPSRPRRDRGRSPRCRCRQRSAAPASGSAGSIGVVSFAVRRAWLGIGPTNWPQFRLMVSMLTGLPVSVIRRDEPLELGAFEQRQHPERLLTNQIRGRGSPRGKCMSSHSEDLNPRRWPITGCRGRASSRSRRSSRSPTSATSRWPIRRAWRRPAWRSPPIRRKRPR